MKLNLTKEAVEWFFSRDCSEYSPFSDMDKARKICDMRLKGKTYVEISEEIDLVPDRARYYVAKVQRTYECMLRQEEYTKRKKNNQNELQNAFRLIEIEYDNAKRCKHIKKPLAHAIYEVWRRVDTREKERNVNKSMGKR